MRQSERIPAELITNKLCRYDFLSFLCSPRGHGVGAAAWVEFLLRPSPTPTTDHTASANHSYREKWPGTSGITFIHIRQRPTITPTIATNRLPATGFMRQ